MDRGMRVDKFFEAYVGIKTHVLECGYAWEIDWQDSISQCAPTERDFLRESAWVILSSGMKEAVVRSKFAAISEAFLDWQSANHITVHEEQCRSKALRSFGHYAKISAIVETARIIDTIGFHRVWNRVQSEGIDYLETFPFVGPITKYHLAKNLGLEVVKPDRHLSRLANACGYEDPAELCRRISVLTGERLSVIDVVLWRFATLVPDYERRFVEQDFCFT